MHAVQGLYSLFNFYKIENQACELLGLEKTESNNYFRIFNLPLSTSPEVPNDIRDIKFGK